MGNCYACHATPGLLAGLCDLCALIARSAPSAVAHRAARRAVAERYNAADRLRRKINAERASTCNECRGHFPAESIEVDHFIPLASGGTDTEGNVRALCVSCHRAKTESERGRQCSARTSPTSRI